MVKRQEKENILLKNLNISANSLFSSIESKDLVKTKLQTKKKSK